jgi:hypothetical protein
MIRQKLDYALRGQCDVLLRLLNHTRWQAMLVQMLRANGEAVKPEIGEPDLGLHRPLEILQFRGPDRDQL